MVNIMGILGIDLISGTNQADIIGVKEGGDEVLGRGGNDKTCGDIGDRTLSKKTVFAAQRALCKCCRNGIVKIQNCPCDPGWTRCG
jgi:Ca2+-binding RTX toxin-like protein